MRALIADDEPLARERLKGMLQRQEDVTIVAECADGRDALAAIGAAAPDVAFLDLQMPGCDGLAVVRELPEATRPAIIFVTAHDDHALEAFQVGAVDYLLKPFDVERLELALRRASTFLAARDTTSLATRLERLLSRHAPAPRGPDRITVRHRGRIIFVAPEDISHVESGDNHVVLHLLNGGRHLLRETLSAVETRLGAARFVRLNRSTLVQLDQIRELRSSTYGDYTVTLRNGARIPLSRSLRGKLEDLVG